jgi:crotonobetainyl-CoA:carnitine CoA-transferase CaiB-like acyl-CoA transferase
VNDVTVKGPLNGLRVAELARILAGPWAGQVLADLGADVIKVESPEGDPTRVWGPPFVDYIDGGRDAAYFHACNRGKRSVVADFKTEAGRARARDLCLTADVVIENFRHGDLVHYGLDAITLRAARPALIYCSITGFGQDGPYADRPGYDLIVQAMGGIMDLTGTPDGEGQKTGVAYADIFTGLYAVTAIQAALLQRARTGEGATIDLALLDTEVGVLANQAMNFLVSGTAPRRMGNAHPSLVPYQVFSAADGHMVIAVGSDAQFKHLVEVLGIPTLAGESFARTNADRVNNRDKVVALLQAACLKWARADLVQRLNDIGVPAGPINSLADVFADPQVRARSLVGTVHSRDGEAIPAVRLPVRMTGLGSMQTRASPRLGQHQDETWLK